MDFASRYILNNDEDEYESISEEEFEQGMQVSESDSSEEDESPRVDQLPRLQCDSAASHQDHSSVTSRALSRDDVSQPPKKKKVRHHWKLKGKSVGKAAPMCLGGSDQKKEARKLPSRRQFRKADTNIVSVSFNTLLKPGSMHAGEPVVCDNCKALLSHISKVDADTKVWQCEFCDELTTVDIEPEEIPSADDVTYLLEPAMATSTSTMSGLDQSLVVFCMDTSGSMCVTTEVSGKIKLRGTSLLKRLQSFNDTGENQFLPSQRNHEVTYISRLQAMQAAVDHQLGEMAKDHPNRRVALITYCNEVTIVGDGSQEQITVAGDKLNSEEELCKAGSEAPLPQAIRGSRKVLGDKVYSLEEGGSTALGPALTVAINMAAHHPGSKVILCTDGKANVGLGKLEEATDEQAASDFYTQTAQNALDKGVTVSVITIEGTDCKLVHLGMLADKTGGQVNIVDPLKLTEEFTNILADPIIATKVKATFILHKELYVVDELDPDSQLSRAEHTAGNVKSSTSITFEFAKKKRPKDASAKIPEEGEENAEEKSTQPPSESGDAAGEGSTEEGATAAAPSNASATTSSTPSDFPFQLQIEYMDAEGNKALRVITRTMPATSDRRVTEEHANLDVLGIHAAKKSTDLALQGQFSKSRGVALMNQRLAWRHSKSDASSTISRSKYKDIYSKIQVVENCIQRKQMQEYRQFGRTLSDSESAESDDEDKIYEAPTTLQSLAAPPPPPPTGHRTASSRSDNKGYIAKKYKKMHAARTSEMEDAMANMMYNFRSSSDIVTPFKGNTNSASGSGSDKKDEDSKKDQDNKEDEDNKK